MYQCVEMYTKSERAISAWAILGGNADAAALSLNKVLFGEFWKFLKHFDAVVEEAARRTTAKEIQTAQQIYKTIIAQFEARERIFYALVAFQQRGRVPLKLSAFSNGLMGVWSGAFIENAEHQAGLGSGNNLERDERLGKEALESTSVASSPDVEQVQASAETAQDVSPDAAPGPSVSPATQVVEEDDGFATRVMGKMRRIRLPGSSTQKPHSRSDWEEAQKMINRVTTAEQSGKQTDQTRTEKIKIKEFIRDVYHRALRELLQICHESITGLDGLIENFLHISDGKNEDWYLEEPNWNNHFETEHLVGSAKYVRHLITSAEWVTRILTRIYFALEYENKKHEIRRDANRQDLSYLHKLYESADDKDLDVEIDLEDTDALPAYNGPNLAVPVEGNA